MDHKQVEKFLQLPKGEVFFFSSGKITRWKQTKLGLTDPLQRQAGSCAEHSQAVRLRLYWQEQDEWPPGDYGVCMLVSTTFSSFCTPSQFICRLAQTKSTLNTLFSLQFWKVGGGSKYLWGFFSSGLWCTLVECWGITLMNACLHTQTQKPGKRKKNHTKHCQL